MTGLLQDLRYACRTLRKNPLFTTAAVLTLALGIGANSAIFTLINAALLRPLPFPQPEQLALVWEETGMFGLRDSPVALGNYTEWRARNRVFQRMGALEQRTWRLSGTAQAQEIKGSVVTAGVFQTLGVQPALGRLFREDENQPGTARTAILSDGLWRREFGRDPGAVGRAVEINDEKFEIVGVMPPGFHFPESANELWLPIGTAFRAEDLASKGRHNAMVVARLRPGVSLAAANRELAGIARSLEREFPDTNARVGAFAAPLRDHFVAELRGTLAVLAGAVAFVLLIACANIANLLLSRASNRRREVAIRAAIGAGRAQVARQLFTEYLVLAVAGGTAGLGLAVWGVGFLGRMMPAGIASMSAVTVDARVLAFTLAVSLLTALVFGLAPVFEMMRMDIQSMLRHGGARQGAGPGSRRLQRALVVAEVALAFLLLMGAGLFIQSFARLRGLDPGFRTANILTLRTPLGGRQYADPVRRAAFNEEVLRRVTALPGVVSAGYSNGIPLVVKGDVNGFIVEGRARAAGEIVNGNYRVVTPDYLGTLGIPLRAGRYLNAHDTAGTPPVALINETMQRTYWPGGTAVGKRFRFGSQPWITIVGVVGDVRQSGLDRFPSREMYLPAAQAPRGLAGLAIRTKGDPKLLSAAVRRTIQEVDAGVPVTDIRTMEEVLDREVFQRRAQVVLLAAFAAAALLLAALGIYGVLAYLVAQRTAEIGIRMALGATPRQVLLAVAGQGVALSAAGIGLGAVAALGLTRLVSKLLFGIQASDPATFVGAGILLLAVASAASWLPARRAMRVDPILALRE